MNKGQKAIELDHRIDLYIPSQCICGGELPQGLRNKVIEEVKSRFDAWFGGHAEIPVKGDWRLPDGTIAREEVADIYSFCTSEALEQYHEDVDQLAVDIANRLTQDRVLRVFDNLKVALWPNTLENLIPKKNCACRGGAPIALAAPVQPTELGKAGRVSKMLVIQGILRSCNSIEHVRLLFCDVLNYSYATGELPCGAWPAGVRSLLADAPLLLAEHSCFKVVNLRISADQLRRGAERQVIQRIFKDDPTFRGLFVVSDRPQENWELINIKLSDGDSSRLVLRRMRVGIESVRTATERLATVEIGEAEESTLTTEEIQARHEKAFDVEAVTKAFFIDIANWYFWALKHVRFPKDAPKEKDSRDHVSVIRLITRLIFCWFMKQKNLIPGELFNERKLTELLVGFAPDKVSNNHSVFYKAILQNLFFATLNTEMSKRAWRRDGQNFMAHSLYRHKALFSRPDETLDLFKNIPFLNGGLFECLDKPLGEKGNPYYVRIDGFSDREDSQPTVPDFLFFGEEREIDLSEEYGNKKFGKAKVRGLIHTLHHYHFTVEESTPLEEEVALDPELAGKIFENLLAAYNPETGATARKQTGSFYTPREIVNYMVDEALIAYLKGKLEESHLDAADIEGRLGRLFSYEEEDDEFTEKETEHLVGAIDQLKALDPAVGSGAFPMGILHKLVFILGRLDPRNEKWKERQKKRLQDAVAAAERIEDVTIRESTLNELEQQIDGLEKAFEKNTLDYGRKLYLIENCLYGVDIQPIAVQIAKMRFFISLIADQKVDHSAENLGVRPLPNLETKLVAANTLIGIEKPKQMMLRSPRIEALEAELRRVRERHFLAKTTTSKKKCRDQDQRLRMEIAELLTKDRWRKPIAQQLAEWDPYDQNASSGFFDPEWMFGAQEGLDILIGNPPYIKEYTHRGAFEGVRESPYYQGKMDIWYLFACLGLDMLKENAGVLVFIATNNWVTNSGASKMRNKVIRDAQILKMLDFGSYKIFESSDIQTMVMLFKRNKEQTEYTFDYRKLTGTAARFNDVMDLLGHTENERANYLTPTIDRKDFSNKLLTFSDRSKEKLLNKIQSQANFKFNDKQEIAQGIVAPQDFLNKTSQRELGAGFKVGEGIFCISDQGKKQLGLSKEEVMLVKPYYTTDELFKYYGNPKNNYWIIYTDSSFKSPHRIRPYPNLKKHLDRFKSIITSHNAPYGLHRAREEHFFKGEKVIALRKCAEPTFTYTNYDCYVSQTFFVIKSTRINMKFLTALLNAQLIAFWLRHRGKMQGNQFQVDKEPLLEIPVIKPKADGDFITLIDQILSEKQRNPIANTSSLERKIDEEVYNLYGLTPDEIKIVEEGR